MNWLVRRLAAFAAVALLVVPAGAEAQQTTPEDSFTSGTTHTSVFNDVFQAARQDTYLTRIVGRIDGGAVVYDMSFAQAFGNPVIDAAVAAAQAALNAALSPAPTILGPTLIASTVTLESSVTELVSTILTDTTSSPRTIVTFGPALVFIGEDLLTPYQVGDDETNFNTITDFTLFYDRTYLTTDTYLTSQTYELVGYAQQVVSGVPEPASLALLGLGVLGLAVRRQRARLLAGALALLAFAPATSWAQGTEPGTSETFGTTHTSIFNDIFQAARQDTYLTRIVGRIDGGPVVYDMSFAQAFGNPTIDAAVAAAQAALNAALSPAPTILGPTQVASTVTLESSVMELASTILTDTTSSPRVIITFGPALIFIGEDLLTPYQVGDNESNFNTIIDYTLFYDRTYVTTETYLTSQTYELVGYPQQVAAGVPEPTSLALLALGLGLALRRRLRP